MDTAYLKKNLGDSLSKCLSEVSEKRPRDPIEYIAQWLYKYVENQNHAAQVNVILFVQQLGAAVPSFVASLHKYSKLAETLQEI